jgi:hypothetical protein
MITRGEGALGTIYERLRKRSYRKMCHSIENRTDAWDDYWWYVDDHESYVKGVKDALQAVEAGYWHTPRKVFVIQQPDEQAEMEIDPVTGSWL